MQAFDMNFVPNQGKTTYKLLLLRNVGGCSDWPVKWSFRYGSTSGVDRCHNPVAMMRN